MTMLANAVPSSRRGTAPIHSERPAADAGAASQVDRSSGAGSNDARRCVSPSTWFTPATTPSSTRLVSAASAAWRAWLPTAVATLGTLALLALFGQTLQLFNVLALALLLGIGIDYGIFLLEREDADAGSAWLAVVLGAAGTWLSFGLTLLFGILIVWLVVPCYRPTRRSPTA